ncbi:hypothetical protein DRW41_22065 [Neobacillus piezotolerans]|uniref:Uncharacterized protein n=1 Tax=Neobacillus piezotolerans TaxID=2259171 RepID=A0A3D8GJT6_9BACI|nr:hypothetical protein [Neobacillus piezotolerans]RDU34713.1 hypothetical protein DRW41_22065 [Neobacillus piezotolerans]
MQITITIDYHTNQSISMSGTFPLRGRKPEKVAFEWWKEIKRDSFNPVLEKVIINGDRDVTELVKTLDKAPPPPDNLPF